MERGASAAINSRSGIDLKTSDADFSIAGRYGISDANAGRIVIFELFETKVDVTMIVEFFGLVNHETRYEKLIRNRRMISWMKPQD